MRIAPEDIQLAGPELAIRWSDGVESYLVLEDLRRACPCATCAGEPDALGHVAAPEVVYDPARSFRLRAYNIIGGYAFQPTWEDGHNTGLYAFPALRAMGQTEEEAKA